MNIQITPKPRINTIGDYLRREFGKKTVKLSIDAGFTCPNRDGKLGYGGCAFCSGEGSGELASSLELGIAESISQQIEKLSKKWQDAAYLAYFQSHTNTYAPVELLRSKFADALSDPRIDGIVIATRPDCLGVDVLDLLSEINENHFMWVELGLQTIHPETSKLMGIGYDIETYDRAVSELNARNIKVVSHLILGLPGETEEMMLESVRHACKSPIFGIKLHLMNVIRTSRLYDMMPDYVPFQSIDEYVDLVIRCLRIIPPEVTIHRLTGDVPRSLLVSPEWSYRKRTILNSISNKLSKLDIFQGDQLR